MLKIEFKITTSQRLKCYGCNSGLRGGDGFIKIWKKWGNDIKICVDCFDEFMKEVNEKRKTSVKDYKKLLKDRILRNLK